MCACLPNLTKLSATYGVKKIGMKYERILFGMKISDASSLARTVLTSAPNLTTLVLNRSVPRYATPSTHRPPALPALLVCDSTIF